jgi:hypothetical protein
MTAPKRRHLHERRRFVDLANRLHPRGFQYVPMGRADSAMTGRWTDVCANGRRPPYRRLAGTIQIEKVNTVWRACGDENKASFRASTGGTPNGAAAD